MWNRMGIEPIRCIGPQCAAATRHRHKKVNPHGRSERVARGPVSGVEVERAERMRVRRYLKLVARLRELP